MMADLDKLMVLEDFLRQGVWFLDWLGGARLTGITIKVEPAGKLVILKAITAEGPKVAFVGAGTLDAFRRKVTNREERESINWRVDQFALDNLGKNR